MNSKQKLSAILVEDEQNARIIFKSMLERYAPEIELLKVSKNVAEAITDINQLKPDVLFLDIQLPDGNGFDILNRLSYKGFHLIFVTAFDHYAIKAIKFNAFDYLLKPVDYLELKKSIAQLGLAINKGLSAKSLANYESNANTEDKQKHRLAIPSKDTHTFVPIEDILVCQADQSYTWIYLNDGERILSSKNLGEYERVLPGPDDFDDFFFYRIHHGYMINTKYIKQYISKDLKIEMTDGKEWLVSRRRKVEFQQSLEKLDEYV